MPNPNSWPKTQDSDRGDKGLEQTWKNLREKLLDHGNDSGTEHETFNDEGNVVQERTLQDNDSQMLSGIAPFKVLPPAPIADGVRSVTSSPLLSPPSSSVRDSPEGSPRPQPPGRPKLSRRNSWKPPSRSRAHSDTEKELLKRPSQRRVDDLKDFTDEFIARGYHAEYCSWRDQYLRWRKGEGKGARGEMSHQELENATATFEFWYPTVSSFTFRRTCAYWVAVLFAEGSLLFMWVPAFELYGTSGTHLHYSLTKLPSVCGALAYMIGAYCGYFELINMNAEVETGEINRLWCNWGELLKLLRTNCELEDKPLREYWLRPLSSIIGWSFYLIGTILYMYATISDTLGLSEFWESLFVSWPLCIGGFLFLIGGICEVIQNEIYIRPPTTFVWWVSAMNTVGGVCFWTCACPSIFQGERASFVSGFGATCYFLAGVLSLCMWRGEQFGLALISHLNAVHRDAGTQIAVRKDKHTGKEQVVVASSNSSHNVKRKSMDKVVTPALSWRGISFVNLYIACATLQLLNCCASCSQFYRPDIGSGRVVRHFMNTFLASLSLVIIVHMVLLLNSACVRMPKEQPYRALTFMMRILAIVFAARSFLTFELFFEDDTLAENGDIATAFL